LLGFFLNKLRWVIIIRSADIDRLSIFFNIHSKTYNFIMLDGIGKTLHNTWWNWWNITQHLVELVKHYTTLDGIGKTLHNTWWNWFFFITQHLVELVKHYTTLGGIGKTLTQHLVEMVKHYTIIACT
jgi:hypothetical protein